MCSCKLEFICVESRPGYERSTAGSPTGSAVAMGDSIRGFACFVTNRPAETASLDFSYDLHTVPPQFLSRYPVLKIQPTTARQIMRNPKVIARLTATLTSDDS